MDCGIHLYSFQMRHVLNASWIVGCADVTSCNDFQKVGFPFHRSLLTLQMAQGVHLRSMAYDDSAQRFSVRDVYGTSFNL